jgi:hypothetical protein
MKKILSIVLTTGLLMGTVAFGALAFGAGDRDQDQPFQGQKKIVVVQERERQQPPVVKRDKSQPQKELVVKIQAKKPGTVEVAVKSALAPVPALEKDKRVMPQGEPSRR